jgi:hypothetical protein
VPFTRNDALLVFNFFAWVEEMVMYDQPVFSPFLSNFSIVVLKRSIGTQYPKAKDNFKLIA